MATYKEVKGVTIQTRDSDPVIGGVAGASWASGGSLNTARGELAGAGTQTAALMFGGADASSNKETETESYNGSAYTEVADLNTGRNLLGSSGTTNTASLAFGGDVGGGSTTANTESWNGSSWTEVNNLNSSREAPAGFGSSTAALASGGKISSATGATEQWDGTSWTEVNDLNTARRIMDGAGSYTDGLVFGGWNDSSQVGNTETWDGSSWTEVNDLNTARYNFQAAGGTDSTTALCVGGYTSTRVANTESWDGSSWTEVNDLSTARSGAGVGGSMTAAVASGGSVPPLTTITEEFTAAPVTAAILTEGSVFLSGGTTLKGFGKAAGIPATTWASGGNMNVPTHARGGAGTSESAAIAVGANPSPKAQTEIYNGSTWTEVNDLNTGRQYIAAFGTTTAAIGAGGSPGSGYSALVESWNGSSWTEVNDLNTPRGYFAGSGKQTSGIVMGGEPASHDTKVEVWDGNSWTEVSEVNTGVRQFARAGHTGSNDALKAGGYTGTAPTADTEIWNGTSWTEVNNLNSSRYACYGDGATSGQSLAYGGTPSPTASLCESWNGTSWTEVNDLSTARANNSGNGTSVSQLCYGGDPGGANTEEFVSSNTLSTVTVS